MADKAPEWLIEDGIGERRALFVQDGEVLAAKLHWPGELTAGEIHSAKLTIKTSMTRRGMATLDNGAEVLLDHLPPDCTEGARITLRISRSAISEQGRHKYAQGRIVRDTETSNISPHWLGQSHKEVRQFASGLWEEVWHSASSGQLDFVGGEIVCSPTPAMTLIDIDCSWPQEAYFNAVPTISRALRWFDIGGNIGIDFPTILDKSDRKACDSRLDEYLSDWPHERTAMNGFGFVQMVARLEGPSLLHRFATSRIGMCARYALRVAERAEGIGPILLLSVHPALKAKLKPEWLDELSRRTGREVRIETNATLALEAPQAQIIAQ